MAVVSLSKAARLVGVSRATLLQVVDSGKLQTIDMDDGRRGVDTSDLERIYGFLLPDSVADTTVLQQAPPLEPIPRQNEAIQGEMARFRKSLEAARLRQPDKPSRSRTGLVLGFAGMLMLMLAVAMMYRLWPGLTEAPPLAATPNPTSARTSAPEPPPVTAAETPAYIDSVVMDDDTSPAAASAATEPTEPTPTPLPGAREVVAAAVLPAGDPETTTAMVEPTAPPPAEAPPRSELGAFMADMESGEFVVVVGSFSSEESAIQGRNRLREAHPELFQPMLAPTAGNTEGYENYYRSGNYWVVYVGDFYSRESAERLREKAVNELGMRGDSFLQRP